MRSYFVLLSVAVSSLAFAQAPGLGPVPSSEQVDPFAGVAIGSIHKDPLAHLPSDIEMISPFGERPVFAPDNSKVMFIGEGYGDAFEIDLRTRAVRNVTSHTANRGFLRAHYLADGSHIFLGPRMRATDPDYVRRNQIELWYMGREPGANLVALNITNYEGIATSRRTNKIAWAQRGPNFTPFKSNHPGYLGPEPKPDEYNSIWTGDVVVNGNSARIENAREVLRKPRTDCMPEPQDFRDADQELTFSCYRLSGPISKGAKVTTGIWGVRLDGSQKVIRYRGDNWDQYSEPEGIAPGGKWTAFECSDYKRGGMDVCKLEFEPDSKKITRITHVSEDLGARVSNPVISNDGRQMVFSFAKMGDDSGVGRGILVMQLPQSGAQ